MPNVPKGNGELGPRARLLGMELPLPKVKKKKKKKKLKASPKKKKTIENKHDPRTKSQAYPKLDIPFDFIPKIQIDYSSKLFTHDLTAEEIYEVIYLDSENAP